MKLKYIPYLLSLSVILITESCVSIKKHEEVGGKLASYRHISDSLKSENTDLLIQNTELSDNILRLSKRKATLEADTIALGFEYRKTIRAYNDLGESYELLLKNNSNAMAKQAVENRELMEKLGQMDLALQQREKSIMEREEDVLELQNLLKQKDKNLELLKQKVANALLGFQAKGLTVTQREGKLYVSLENSLLFSSGSWTVNSKGEKAIIELSKVLSEQDNIHITVEGHTDNIPYKGTGLIKDNWDLSVMRATAIVKILTNNKGVNSENITAAGRGPNSPLVPNNSSENRAVNRRTEIILSPNMDEIIDLLD